MNRRGPLIAGAVSAVLALVLVMMLVLPKMHDVAATNDQLQNAKDQELVLQAELRALQDAQAAAPDTEAQIAALEKQVPPTPDLPGLFVTLQSVADQSAVDFFQFSPGTPTPDPTGTYAVIASQITVTGGYFSIDEFLYNLETLERAAKVTSITLGTSGGATSETGSTGIPTSNRLSAQISVNFYTTDTTAGPGSLPEPSPTESPAAEPAASPTPEPGA